MNRELFSALVRLAITSDANLSPRVEALTNVAFAYREEGDDEACDQVFLEAIAYLDSSSDASTERAYEAQRLAWHAAQLNRTSCALSAYELAVRLFEESELELPDEFAAHIFGDLGGTLHDLASIRLAEGDGEAALVAYRRAADAKRNGGDVPSLLRTLLALADVEARWGEQGRCDAALEEVLAHLGGAALDESDKIATVQALERRAEALGRTEVVSRARTLTA